MMGVRLRHAGFRGLPGLGPRGACRDPHAARAETVPEIYVLPSEKLPALKNLGDTARSLGLEVLKRLLERDCIHSYRYQALLLLAKHKPGLGWTDATRQAALEEARQFYTAADPKDFATGRFSSDYCNNT